MARNTYLTEFGVAGCWLPRDFFGDMFQSYLYVVLLTGNFFYVGAMRPLVWR